MVDSTGWPAFVEDWEQQPGYFKRRRRLADALEWLPGIFASQSRSAGDR